MLVRLFYDFIHEAMTHFIYALPLLVDSDDFMEVYELCFSYELRIHSFTPSCHDFQITLESE